LNIVIYKIWPYCAVDQINTVVSQKNQCRFTIFTTLVKLSNNHLLHIILSNINVNISNNSSKIPHILLLYRYQLNLPLSLQSGIISDIWNHASVVPVFKKESLGDPCNFRPISVTCIACKLMDVGIADALLIFLREQWLIDWCFMARQHKIGQFDPICNLDWNTAIKSRHGVDIVYFDFARAFDSVVHCIGLSVVVGLNKLNTDMFQQACIAFFICQCFKI